MELDNGVSLDFADDHGLARRSICAFLVSEDEFDEMFGRIRDRGLQYRADPGRRKAGEINHNDGGRGVYWEDSSGHFLEIPTSPSLWWIIVESTGVVCVPSPDCREASR